MATLSSLLPASVVTNLAAGDSDVTITDSGTGKVEVTVDNVEVADFTTGAIVFNETGANQDFRVEGDTNANLIVADAGVDKVGIGTNTFNTNGGVLQVSNGISFPATQSAASDANTLDDYEEGTWTATVSDGTNNASMGLSGGFYTKIGNLVTISANIQLLSKGSITGNLRLIGLPFTVANNNAAFGGVSFPYGFNLNITAGQTLGGWVAINETYMNLHLWDSATGTTQLQATELTDTSGFLFCISYRAA